MAKYNVNDFDFGGQNNTTPSTQSKYMLDDFSFGGDTPDDQNGFSAMTEGAGEGIQTFLGAINPFNMLARAQDKRFKRKETYGDNVEGLIGAIRGVNALLPGSEPTLGEIQGNMGAVESAGHLGAGLVRNIIPAAAGTLARGRQHPRGWPDLRGRRACPGQNCGRS